MQGHNKDLEERDAMIERMQISHEEQIAKKEKEKAILKQRLEDADLHLARSQKEAQHLNDHLSKKQLKFENEVQRLTVELEQREGAYDQTCLNMERQLQAKTRELENALGENSALHA